VLASLALFAGSAVAVTPAANLSVHVVATPTVFSAGDNAECANTIDGETRIVEKVLCDAYRVTVTNVGSVATAEGAPIVVSDSLPAGLKIQTGTEAPGISLLWSGSPNQDLGGILCEGALVRCEFPVALAPDASLTMIVFVRVEPGAPGSLADTASVSGGGVAGSSASVVNGNGGAPALFGVSAFSTLIAGVDGSSDTQAGEHSYELTTVIDPNTVFRNTPEDYFGLSSVHDVKDVVVDLPLGFAGSALSTPMCPLAQLGGLAGAQGIGRCPPDTGLGHVQTGGGLTSVNGPLYNMVPERGVAAEFGFVDTLRGTHIIEARVVSTPAGYVLRAMSSEIPQILLRSIVVNLYGNPAERDGSGNVPVAEFTEPSDCSGEPLVTTIHMDSWQEPGRYNADGTPDFSDPSWKEARAQAPPVTGCDQLRFEPSLGAQPETSVADTPSGLGVELRVPQSEVPGTLATPPLKKAVVTLPAGLSINPSAAGGLAACSLAQIGMSASGEPNASQPSCPEASKIGTIEVTTPAVATVLQGSIYLASQNENPFHALLAGYIVIDDPTTGVLVKVPGRIDPDPSTGQLTVTVDQIPQFQVSDLKIHIFGGPRGPLTTPQGCGTYTTSSQLTPWSAPDSGPPATPSDSFQITSGCPGGFNPSFTAGTTNNQAGSFSPFTATFSRTDQDQNLAGVTVTTPPGLLGVLKGVERCPEPQASLGTCGPNSLIGHTTVGAGSGPDPFYVQGSQDQVFFTGPYKGAPFGLSVVVPAVAGPFNLGNVVVRAAINIDPHTAQITVVSDPLPTILDGIPLDVRTVNIAIDRQGFIFNPTNCEPLAVNGVLTSTQGATAGVSSHFQAANCAALAFHPSFTVSTKAKSSKQNGASLTAKVTSGPGQANIGKVSVTLPKQLPSRLTTIQQACPEATFAANPASCPAGSDIGIATTTTPILATSATGPAYLVSHGGAAFPNLVMIFQDEGVKIELIGSISIKKGVTSSAFNDVPDVPITSFELTLPQGPHSALTTNLPAKLKGNLCGQSLVMPTTLTGQNGAQIKQSTKIAVTGCPKTKKKGKTKRRKGKK